MKLPSILLAAFLLSACGDASKPGAGGGAYYGTCDYRPASDHCVDYYCDSASTCTDPTTNGQTTCTSGGASGSIGAWSTTACPTTGRTGTCSYTTTGDGKLVNSYYKTDGKTACGLAGGTWTAG